MPAVFPKRVIVLSLIAAGLLAVCVFRAPLLTEMAKLLMLSDAPEPADLVLILGGDFWGPRAVKGAELGARGYAPRVLISGPPYANPSISGPESELSIRFLVEKGYPRELFLGFPNSTKSTVDEAIAVCPELRRLGARKVLIVTSAYHSRRANLALRLFCPDVKFRSVGAADSQFQAEGWWKIPAYRAVFFSEWTKIAGTILWSYPKYLLTGGRAG